MQNEKRRLICYLDESGDFGPYSEHSPAYCFSFVFVTPESDYLQKEEKYQRRISRLTGGDHFVHVGNLVRAEEPYEGLLRESRADLFGTLLFFYLHSGLNCARFRVKKDGIDSNDGIELSVRISIELGKWISRHLEYLSSFDEIELLYDYGQPNLVRAISSSFAANGFTIQISKKKQEECTLLQVADMLCNVELLQYKIEEGHLSHSDIAFFGLARKIKKDLIKPIKTLQLF